MAEVKWPARRISDGVLVDVTADTEGLPLVSPVENELTVGSSGEQKTRILGPLHFAHDDAGITADGIALATGLVTGTWLLHVDVVVSEAFDGITDDNFTMDIGLRGGAVLDGQYRNGWTALFAATLTLEGQGGGFGTLSPKGSGYYTFRRVSLTEPGMLVLYFSPDGVSTAGEADVYALIAEPA